MNALDRVRRARRILAATATLAALLRGAAAGMGVVAVAAAADRIAPLPPLVRAALWPLATLAAGGALGALLWRWRAVASVQRVALWIEERQRTLDFALVTAIDPAIAPAERYAALHAHAATADVGGVVGRAARRELGRALAAAAALGAALWLLQPRDLLREAGAELARRTATPPAPMPNRLASITARVVPPAYSERPDTTLDDPNAIVALVGSRIEFGGVGPAEGVTAALGADTLEAEARGAREGEARDGGEREGGRRWRVRVTMPEEPAVVAFRDREYSRLVVLEPRPDSVPVVRLRLPANDTTYPTVPRGRLVIEARLEDDVGLDHGYVEYMLSTGGQESFQTEMSRGPRIDFGHARTATLRDVIDLDTMKLAPGTVLHIRAVAFDRNDVTGPGKGVSETRTLRVAEPVDSVSINPAPPLPIDSMWISQRLLNMKTDTLIRMRHRLDRRTFVYTSSGYGNAQDAIRQRALAVIAVLEDDGVGGTFQTEASAKLRVAVDLMYEARVLLGIAQPDSAMPYMIRILEILDEIRLANRYYLRGVLRPEAVDVARVRLTGEDPGADSRRAPRRPIEDARARLSERIARAAALAGQDPQAAMDSLTYIRVAALTKAPAVAEALAGAIDLLRRGAPPDSALARTRRSLEPPPVRLGGPVEWGGTP
ncbi:MAG TPA: hypothetical protein VF212_17555 [Longimicrobiales bacterium]